jgi:hypothetical protein
VFFLSVVTGRVFLDLSDDDLQRIGVSNATDRSLILSLIPRLMTASEAKEKRAAAAAAAVMAGNSGSKAKPKPTTASAGIYIQYRDAEGHLFWHNPISKNSFWKLPASAGATPTSAAAAATTAIHS